MGRVTIRYLSLIYIQQLRVCPRVCMSVHVCMCVLFMSAHVCVCIYMPACVCVFCMLCRGVSMCVYACCVFAWFVRLVCGAPHVS